MIGAVKKLLGPLAQLPLAVQVIIGVVVVSIVGCCGLGVAGLILNAVDPVEDEPDADRPTSSASSEPAPESEPAEPSSTATETEATQEPELDERIWPGSDMPLSEFAQYDSYPWRVNAVDHQDELLDALAAVRPVVEDGDLARYISVCDDLSGGNNTRPDAAGRDLIDRAALIFAPGFDPIPRSDAEDLVELTKRVVCP